MKALLLLLALAAPPPLVPLDGIIHVRRGLGSAHACAVREDILLTAKHVVGEGWRSGVRWSDLAGNEGTAVTVDLDVAADLAVLRITRGRPGRVWPLAKTAPKKGDRVRIIGYNDDVLKPKVVEAKVIAVDAGHIDYSKSPGPGSSGYCALNDADEVVAINFAYNPDTGRGYGVSVYGEWAPPLPARDVTVLR